ncbi:MAG: adenosylcobinamide-GDP ribazoletransferase [Pseudomonadota bacterium]
MTPLAAARAEGRAALSALQFATRLPVPDPGWEPGRMALAAAWLPLAGALTGALAGGVYAAALTVLPPLAAAVVAVAALLWLTGALHEDGLADLADATGGQASPERAREIMRDSRLGTYGVLSLVVLILLRVTALATLSAGEGVVALILAGAIGRAALLAVATALPPAQAEGLGAALVTADGVAAVARRFRPRALVSLAVTAGAAVVVAGAAGLAALAAAGVLAALLARIAMRRLGGATGDVYGAVAAAGEAAALLALSAATEASLPARGADAS